MLSAATRTYDLDAEIATFGSIDLAIVAANVDGLLDLAGQLLARKAKPVAEETDDQALARLRRAAHAKRARFQTEMAEYSHNVGRATYLLNEGRDRDALPYEQAAQRSLTFANELLVEAEAFEAEAVTVRARVQNAQALMAVAS
jgi:hypothetical protein